MNSDRTFWGAVAALGFFFVLSLVLYGVLPGNLVRTVLQFPGEISHELTPEARSLPFNWDTEHNTGLLVKEILLGPSKHDHLRLFSRDAELKTVLVRQGIVYVDLSKEAFNPDPDVLYSPVADLKVLKATLKDNFSWISTVFVSIDGEPTEGNLVDKG